MENSAFSPLYEAIKARLPKLRTAAHLNQRQLAGKLARDHSVITRLEQGQRRVDCLEFYYICKACGVSALQEAAALMREIEALEKKRRRTTKRR